MIKHHNYFKVHLPKEYKGKNDNEFMEILMEEAHLISDGEWTKDYNPKNPKKDKLEISVYPSIVYAYNKFNYSENKKFHLINDYIDNSFVDFLEGFNPLHKCTSFIEYHFYFYQGNKIEFYKHIKYQILSIIKKRKKSKKKDFDYETLEIIINDWLKEKMKKNTTHKNTVNAENVIINNNSKIKNQSINSNSNEEKESFWNKFNVIIALVVGIFTIIGIIWGF